jgi:hypothetical protein
MLETTDDTSNTEQVIPAAAHSIIVEIISQLRRSTNLTSVMQFAIEALTKACKADRGLIWQLDGDQLTVTNEYSVDGNNCFSGKILGTQESTAVVIDFLSHSLSETEIGIISIPDTKQDPNLQRFPTLSPLMELGNVHARLLMHLRSRGIFSGFLEIQQCQPRVWTEVDALVLQTIGNLLSVIVQQSFDQSKIEMDAKEMKLINEVACLFRDSYGLRTQDALTKSTLLIAEHMGFVHAQGYLAQKELLVPQTGDAKTESLRLTDQDNPFVAVYHSGRGATINVNADSSGQSDQFFGRDLALLLPLISKGERLGVIGLWQRLPNKPQFRPQDRELGLMIAGHLSDVMRADLNVRKLRTDVPDLSLTSEGKGRKQPTTEEKGAQWPGLSWRVLVRDWQSPHKNIHDMEGDGTSWFDELVIGDWFHLEWMHGREWWLALGDASIYITVPKDRPPVLQIQRGVYGACPSSEQDEQSLAETDPDDDPYTPRSF